jgi:hypothetical protein
MQSLRLSQHLAFFLVGRLLLQRDIYLGKQLLSIVIKAGIGRID